jgi:hypothetical protein
MDITREIAIKVRDVVAAGLSHGLGTPEPGKMCVEAAVCYAMGLPHSDKPTCVSPAIRSLKIALNDKVWSSPQARAQGLARLALVQLGSAGAVDDREFARRVVEMTIRVVVPLALRAAATRVPSHAARLEAAAVQCEQRGDRASAIQARNAAYAADADAYAAAADDVALRRDRVLSDFAERVVQILVDMGAPGAQWLDLSPMREGA